MHMHLWGHNLEPHSTVSSNGKVSHITCIWPHYFTVTNQWTKVHSLDHMFFPIALDWAQWGVWLSFGSPVPSRDARVQNILPAAQEGVCEALLLGETETGRDWPGETQPGKDTLLTSWPLVSTKRSMWVLQNIYNCSEASASTFKWPCL